MNLSEKVCEKDVENIPLDPDLLHNENFERFLIAIVNKYRDRNVALLSNGIVL